MTIASASIKNATVPTSPTVETSPREEQKEIKGFRALLKENAAESKSGEHKKGSGGWATTLQYTLIAAVVMGCLYAVCDRVCRSIMSAAPPAAISPGAPQNNPLANQVMAAPNLMTAPNAMQTMPGVPVAPQSPPRFQVDRKTLSPATFRGFAPVHSVYRKVLPHQRTHAVKPAKPPVAQKRTTVPPTILRYPSYKPAQ